MQPDLVTEIARPYLTEGVLGTSVLVLAVVVIKLWAELKGERAAHKVEMAEKDKLITELYDDRINEMRVGYDIAKTTKSSLDAFLVAIGKGQG